MTKNQRWVAEIERGDVLKANGSGTLRIVREVSRGRGHVYVTFVIQHCSWTGRCHTTYIDHEISRLFRPTGVRVDIDTHPMDKRIAKEISNHVAGGVARPIRDLNCCDVKGIP